MNRCGVPPERLPAPDPSALTSDHSGGYRADEVVGVFAGSPPGCPPNQGITAPLGQDDHGGMTDLGTRIGLHQPDQVWDNVVIGQRLCLATPTAQAVQCGQADAGYRILQRAAERIHRVVVRGVIKDDQAVPPDPGIRVGDRGGLHGRHRDGNPRKLPERPAGLLELPQRGPPSRKVLPSDTRARASTARLPSCQIRVRRTEGQAGHPAAVMA